MTRFLALVLVAAYAVTSVGPRGIALCIGGDHGWSEMIAAACGGGGHSHGSGAAHAHHEDDHAAVDCCDHHQSEQHGPCTDITLDQDFARLSSSSSKLIANTDSGSDHGGASHFAATVNRVCVIALGRYMPPRQAVDRVQPESFTRTIVLRL